MHFKHFYLRFRTTLSTPSGLPISTQAVLVLLFMKKIWFTFPYCSNRGDHTLQNNSNCVGDPNPNPQGYRNFKSDPHPGGQWTHFLHWYKAQTNQQIKKWDVQLLFYIYLKRTIGTVRTQNFWKTGAGSERSSFGFTTMHLNMPQRERYPTNLDWWYWTNLQKKINS